MGLKRKTRWQVNRESVGWLTATVSKPDNIRHIWLWHQLRCGRKNESFPHKNREVKSRSPTQGTDESMLRRCCQEGSQGRECCSIIIVVCQPTEHAVLYANTKTYQLMLQLRLFAKYCESYGSWSPPLSIIEERKKATRGATPREKKRKRKRERDRAIGSGRVCL